VWLLSCLALLQKQAPTEVPVLCGSVSGSEIHFELAGRLESALEINSLMRASS